jgi:hypothetical protein
MKYALWTVQALLAALFLFGGVVKLTMPIEEMTAVLPLPGIFIQFIAVCEVLGAIGLIVPGLTRIQPILTPIAAAGLVLIMVGATVITVVTMDVPSAAMPFVTGLLATFVAYGRLRLAPQSGTARRLILQSAS